MITTLLLATVPTLQQAPTPAAPLPLGRASRATTGGRTPVPPAAGIGPQPHVSAGQYDEASFNYSDPYAPAFHPLGSEVFTATLLEESVLLNDGRSTLTGLRRDDALSGSGTGGSMSQLSGSTTRRAAAAGDLRGDGTLQLLTLEGSRLIVRERTSSGGYVVLHDERLPTSGGIHYDCADVDGDGRDELVCAVATGSTGRTHEVWIFDDLVDGPWGTASTLPRLDRRVLGSASFTARPAIAPAQLDGDAREELFLVFEVNGTRQVYAVDDLGAGLATIADDSSFATARPDDVLACAADLDGNGVDELVVGTRTGIVALAVAGSSFNNGGSIGVPELWQGLAAVDYNGDGVDEVAYIDVVSNQFSGDRAELRLLERVPPAPFGGGGLGVVTSALVYSGSGGFGSLATVFSGGLVALEDDNDGRGEIRGYVAVSETSSGGDGVLEFRYEAGGLSYIDERQSSSAGGDWFIVAGEDDRETAVLRYTGQKDLQLAAPLPIVVMEAVPTKEGIQQNYLFSGSTFSSSSGTSTSYSTTTATTIGITGGFTSPNLFGLFESQATATISGTVANTTGSSESVRTFTTYGSDHDVHSVVFQGTLYHSYLYEVVRAADPAAIGSTVALNVPVATNEWKWTLDAYNAAFPNGRIEPTVVFAHSGGVPVIGDPTSYPSQAELEGYVTGASPLHTGWIGGSSTVGEGTSFNGFGLALGNVNTTSSERTLAVETGVSFAAAGTVFGASFGVSSTDVFTVETSTETEYAAQIGDIAPADYAAWSYTAGMVVYQDRINGTYPFQVIRYWAEPTGTSY